VDREVHHRGDKRRMALLKRAGLKYPQACIEDVDSRAGRGFERSSLMSLALSRWVEDGTAILISGVTGSLYRLALQIESGGVACPTAVRAVGVGGRLQLVGHHLRVQRVLVSQQAS